MRTWLVALVFGFGGMAAGLGIGLLTWGNPPPLPRPTPPAVAAAAAPAPSRTAVRSESAATGEDAVAPAADPGAEAAAASPGADGPLPTEAEFRAQLLALPRTGLAREEFLRRFFGQFERKDFDAALAFVAAIDRKADSDAALLALTRSMLGRTEIDVLRAATNGDGASPAAILARFLNEGSREDVARAATIANSFTSGSERAQLLGESAARLVTTDPAAAQALGAELAGRDYAAFAGRLAAGWAARDPAATREWALALPPGEARNAALAQTISHAASRDLAAAREDLTELSAGSARTGAVRALAQSWAQQETAAALAWADTLPNADEREAARAAIAEVAPSGIGARLSVDQYGFPRIAGLVNGGPASASGTLRSGDRIMAIQDASGQWVDARDMPIPDVAARLRGAPGSAVTFQVASDESGAGPRTVTIYRQQITHERSR